MALEAQANARALTWLDEAELESSGQVSARLATARQARLTFLRSEGLLGEGEVSLSAATRLALRHEEFERVIASEAARSGRSVVTLDAGQSLEGKFERAIGLAQGRMALVGNEKAFALVPWRSGLDHRRGQSLVIEQKSGGISFENPSNSSISCLQAGRIMVGKLDTGKSGEEVFDQNQSLVFKQLAVRRIYDPGSDSLIYVSFSRTIVDGSAKMSLSTVPLYDREVTWTGGKPAAE